MTKGEIRKHRQAEYAAKLAARVNDTRTSQERHADELGKRDARRARSARTSSRKPTPGTQEWAETRGDDLGESPDY